ncbi:MAG TPA: DUF29 domain-containing protein [Crenalkalicoccus sp.]|jgi:hypothetical protein|nr:DUF29 domain-containing protein [Crenalkalicoccus sp.]
MDGDLHDRDFFAWTRLQATALRRLAETHPNLDADLDLPHLIEEVEDLGSEQVHAVRGNLRQMLRHLMFIACQPEDQAVPHWRGEVIAFQAEAVDRFLPSMRQQVEPRLPREWRSALRSVSAKLGEAAGALPTECPYALDEVLDPAATVEALLARLRPPSAGVAGR